MPQNVTIPGVLQALADEAPEAPLILEKRYGKWTSLTRRDIVDSVTELAHGLHDRGLRAGDVAVVMLQSHNAWIVTDLALQVLGVRVAALAADAPVDSVAYILQDTDARMILVQDQDGADRVLAATQQADGRGVLEYLVYVDPAGVAEYTDELLVGYDELRDRGRSMASVGIEAFLSERTADDVAVLSYSHGVSGRPSATLLTHRAIVAGARSTAAALELVTDDRVMAVRPLSDAVERGATLYPAIVTGALVVLPENPATVGQAAWETAPTSTHLTLRHLKLLAAQIRVRMQSARGLKGIITRAWYRRFSKAVERDMVVAPSGFWKVLVASPVLEKLGLNRARQVVVSGDRVPREAVLFFRALGLRITPAYALSQNGGLVTLDTDAEGHDVGRPLDGVEIRIASDGEILLRGESVASGAHGEAPQTVDEDGWLHTGDIGSTDDDRHLAISHRRGEEVRLQDGSTVSCSRIESELRASPYVKDAVIESTDDRVLLVLELMEPTVERWASRQKIQFTTFRSLSQLPEVRELVGRVITEATSHHAALQVDDVVVLDASLDARPGLLTPTGKARRSAVLDQARARLQGQIAVRSQSLPEGNAPVR